MNFDVFEKLRQNKALLCLPWQEIDELRQFLAHNFGIEQKCDGYDYFEVIRDRCCSRIADEFEILNQIRAFGTSAIEVKEAENKFYNLISEDPLLGIVHSQKWTSIFETMSYVTSLARQVEFNGTILDVGCHAGYQTLWLGQALHCHVTGVDSSIDAIRYANEARGSLGLIPRVATFKKVNYETDNYVDSASLILAAFLPMDLQKLFKKVSDVMSDLGLFIWIGNIDLAHDISNLRDELVASGLSIELVDVIGGWGQEEGLPQFRADLVLVLRKGVDPQIPVDFALEMNSIWVQFADYANISGRANSEKTIGQYRTFTTHGSKPVS